MKKWYDDWKIWKKPNGEVVVKLPHSYPYWVKAERSIHIKGKYTKKHIDWLTDVLMCALYDLTERDKKEVLISNSSNMI